MNRYEFSESVLTLVKKNQSIMDSIIEKAKEFEIDIEDVPEYLSQYIVSKLREESEKLHLIKRIARLNI